MINKAVAIKYKKELPAPFIIGKGKKELAKKIVQIAKNNNVKIMQMEELTESLFYLEIGDWIPEELFEIIAELLVFVYKVKDENY